MALSGLFIADGPVVQVRDAYQRIRVHEDDDATQQYKGLLFVMINRYSASASEILLQQCKIIVEVLSSGKILLVKVRCNRVVR